MIRKGHSQVEPDYPTNGLNFKLWTQHTARGDSSCRGGLYVAKTDQCHSYKVLQKVCLLVKFEKDVENNIYNWVYTGGCFADDKPTLYADAVPGETYDFKDTVFEVRQDHREFEEMQDEEPLNTSDEDPVESEQREQLR